MGDIQKFKRPVFNFDDCLKAGGSLSELADTLRRATERCRDPRDAALAEDAFSGPWGDEFRRRAADDDSNVAEMEKTLRGDADQWGIIWWQAATQTNNIAYAEAVLICRDIIEGVRNEDSSLLESGLNDWVEGGGDPADFDPLLIGASMAFEPFYQAGKWIASWFEQDAMGEALETVEGVGLCAARPGDAAGFSPANSFVHYREDQRLGGTYDSPSPEQTQVPAAEFEEVESKGLMDSIAEWMGGISSGLPDPPPPPPIEVVEPQPSLGSGDGCCSINLDLVDDYLSEFVTRDDRFIQADLATALDEAIAATDQGKATTGEYADTLRQVGLPAMELYTGFLHMNVVALALVRHEVGQGRSGVIQVANAAIGATLKKYGLDQAPGLIKINRPEFHGLPPNSGFVDDPVCAANGNFVHPELDLAMPGLADPIAARRTYNAASTAHGRFGTGWSSLLDMHLQINAGSAVARLADGARISFTRASDGTYSPVHGRRLALEQTDDGYTLRQGYTTSWRFDREGRLLGGSDGVSAWTITGDETTITVTEAQTGRSIAYEFDPETALVQHAATSDGRVASWIYDDRLVCIGVERPAGGATYEVDAELRITAITDADGVEYVRNTYDRWGRVDTQLNPFGRTSAYEYDEDGTTRVVEADTRELASQMAHDAQANLLSIVGADGGVMRMEWNDEAQMAALHDRKGQTTRYEYVAGAPDDLITRMIRPDGLEEIREFDDAGRLVRFIDASGGEHRYEYDGDERTPNRIIDPMGATTSFVLDSRELATAITDPDGVVIRQTWDRDGQLLSTGVEGRTAHLSYNAAGELSGIVDAEGRWTDFDVDAGGNVTAIERANGLTRYQFTPAGRVTNAEHDGSALWSIEYGSHGEAVRRFDGEQHETAFEYDAFGRCVAVEADGHRFENRFDPLGQLLGLSVDGVEITTTDYDLNGNWIRTVDADGVETVRSVDVLDRTTQLLVGGREVLAQSHHPNGQPAVVRERGIERRIDVDAAGRPVAVTTGRGTLTLTYTAAGRLASRTTPAGRTATYEYDARGELSSITDADGVVSRVASDGRQLELQRDDDEITLNFDELGRVISWSSGEATGANAWTNGVLESRIGDQAPAVIEVGETGRAHRVTDPAGAVATMERDRLGRITQLDTLLERITIEHDTSGAASAITSSSGESTLLDHTPAGRVRRVATDGVSALSIDHDETTGEITAIVDENGTALVSLQRSELGQMASLSTPDSVVELDQDAMGWTQRIRSSINGTTEWEYDADGLITAVISSAGHRIDIVRSAAGTVEGFRSGDLELDQLPRRTPGQRNAADQITSDDDGRVHRYDDAGRLVESLTATGERYAFEYDAASLLVAETTPAGERRFDYDGARLNRITGPGGDHRFEYDRAGRRVLEFRPNGDIVRFEWNPLNQLTAISTERTDGTAERRSFLYSALGRVELVDDVAIHWDDQLTSKPIGIGDRTFVRSGTHVCEVGEGTAWNAGTVADPYGLGAAGDGIDLGFHGELTVDGFVFMGARIYDPSTRCFLTRDPLAPVLALAGAANPYNYANCDPINRLDPTGLRPISMDEFGDWREKQMMSHAEAFGKAFIEDPLGSVLFVATIAAGAALVASGFGAVGGAVLIGMAISTATGFANKSFNPTRTAVDGIVSGAAAAAGGVVGAKFSGVIAKGVATGATAGAVGGFGAEMSNQKINADGSWNDAPLDPTKLITSTATGAIVGGVAGGLSGKVGGLVDDASPNSWMSNKSVIDASEFVIGTVTSAGEDLLSDGEVNLGDSIRDGAISAGAGRVGRAIEEAGTQPGSGDDVPTMDTPADTPAADIPPDTPAADIPADTPPVDAPTRRPVDGPPTDGPTPPTADTPTPGGTETIPTPDATPGPDTNRPPRMDGDTRTPQPDADTPKQRQRQDSGDGADGVNAPDDGPRFRPDDPIPAPDAPPTADIPAPAPDSPSVCGHECRRVSKLALFGGRARRWTGCLHTVHC